MTSKRSESKHTFKKQRNDNYKHDESNRNRNIVHRPIAHFHHPPHSFFSISFRRLESRCRMYEISDAKEFILSESTHKPFSYVN